MSQLYVASDPLQVVWQALERAGYEPHGMPHDYRSPCPAHDGDNPDALHVSIGADGRALLHCFAYDCKAEVICAALGLSAVDLFPPPNPFPPGHWLARRRQVHEARRADFQGRARTVANVLAALEFLGEEWFVQLVCDCPYCGAPRAALFASSRGIEQLECRGDAEADALGYHACTLDEAQQALAGRVQDRRAA